MSDIGGKPLELVTRKQRRTVRIDGVEYPLRDPEDMSLRDALWFERQAPRIDRLSTRLRGGEVDDGAAEELGALILRVTEVLMGDVPVEVRSRLTDIQKLAVIQAYLGEALKAKGKGFFADGGTGGPGSFPDSSGSTGGPIPTGTG